MKTTQAAGEDVRIEGSSLSNIHPRLKEYGGMEVLGVSGSQLESAHPSTRAHHDRERVAARLSRWLVGTFALTVAATLFAGLFVIVWSTVTGGKDLDPAIATLTKWATTLGTLLAAPLGFVLGHYFKTGA